MSNSINTVWYTNEDTTTADDDMEDLIESDFLRISAQHHIVSRERTVAGSLLMTPTSFIFDIITKDPLDLLEPEQFQVVIPASKISILQLTSNKDNLKTSSKKILSDSIELKVIINQEIKEHYNQASSYGSSVLLRQYSFLLNKVLHLHVRHFLETWFNDNSQFLSNKSDQENVKRHYNSRILSQEQCGHIERFFPPRCIIHDWFQGSQH